MSFYTVQYKIAVNLKLFEPLEIKRSEKFIEKIVLETVQENSKTFLLITFLIPKEDYENCRYEDVPTFLEIQGAERDKFFGSQMIKLWTGSESIKFDSRVTKHVAAIKYHILFDKVTQLKNWILNFIFFHFKIPPVETIYTTTDIPKEFIVLTAAHLSSNQWLDILDEYILEGLKLEIFKGQLQNKTNNMSSIYTFFYSIQNKELDLISKFVIFYGMLQEILESLYGEIDQKKTDDFIVKHLGYGKSYRRIVHGRKIDVTEITYYRNEVAHPVSLGDINNEFKEKIIYLTRDLEKLIRQAGLELSIHYRG